MSPEKIGFFRQAWVQLPFIVWLVALWMMLWGQFTLLAFVTGIVVALFVTRAFQLPPVDLSGRLNIFRGLYFMVTFLGSVVWGSILVTLQVLNPRRQPTAAVVAVPLATNDDLIMTHVGITASLIPGSLVVDTDRENRVIYLHVIGVRGQGGPDKFRRDVQRWEERIVRAVGSKAQVEAVIKRREEAR